MDGAIRRNAVKKQLTVERVGTDFLMSYDETKRMLAVCGTTKVWLNGYPRPKNIS
jgi:hypothetical protein